MYSDVFWFQNALKHLFATTSNKKVTSSGRHWSGQDQFLIRVFALPDKTQNVYTNKMLTTSQ